MTIMILQEHRASQLPLDIEDDVTSVKSSDADIKGNYSLFTYITAISIIR